MIDLVFLAQKLGGDIAGRGHVLCPGPGHSARDRSLSVLLDPAAPDGFRVNSFAGDDWRDCRDHVRAALGLDAPRRPPANRLPAPARAPSARPDKTDLARRLWTAAVPAGGTLAAQYLQHRLGSLPPEALDGRPLRFHPACPFRLDSGETVLLPAMLGAMVDIRTNEFRGIHRTALNSEGSGKADMPGLGNPKKMLGPAAGACIKISPDEDVTLSGYTLPKASRRRSPAWRWGSGRSGRRYQPAALPASR